MCEETYREDPRVGRGGDCALWLWRMFVCGSSQVWHLDDCLQPQWAVPSCVADVRGGRHRRGPGNSTPQLEVQRHWRDLLGEQSSLSGNIQRTVAGGVRSRGGRRSVGQPICGVLRVAVVLGVAGRGEAGLGVAVLGVIC